MHAATKYRNALIYLLPALFLPTGCATKSRSEIQNAFVEKSNSDPVYFKNQFFTSPNTPFEMQLDRLPLSGAVAESWSDTFLPNRWGGGAVRWYGDNDLGSMEEPKARPDMWTYKLYTREELKALPLEMLQKLSPSEKYDILIGRYDYPLTNSERIRNRPEDANWEGVCNGWSSAALWYSEPEPVTIINSAGIKIPFGSSDIKSLLMLHQYLTTDLVRYALLGDQCKSSSLAKAVALSNPAALSGDSLDACSDANAGSFHLVLTNMLGRLKKGLVFDVDRDEEIWNQPVFRYESRILERTASKARVSTDVWYAEEVMPSWTPNIREGRNHIVKATYNYDLELAPDGSITGGSWREGTDRDGKIAPVYHPDFVWFGEVANDHYILKDWKSPTRAYTLPNPVEMGGVIDLWKVSVGKSPDFRGMPKDTSKKM
jgi:Transglutaminase elicitor